jgi:type 1 glutamine amidotransferase
MTKKGVKRTDNDFATAWTRTQGKGRVFYTALGHRPEVWDDARFQQHLVEGVRWVTSK